MKGSRFRKFKAFLLRLARGVWRSRDYSLRLAIAWVIALSFYVFDQLDNVDLRLNLRAQQPLRSDILLVHLTPENWLQTKDPSLSLPKFRKHPKLSDRFFWSSRIWDRAIQKILVQDPKAIIVSLNFTSQQTRSRPSFRDPRVWWMSRKGFLTKFDRDRVYRRVHNTYEEPDPILKWAQTKFDIPQFSDKEANRLVNFRGPRGSFQNIELADLLKKNNRISFKNKIVIFGAAEVADHEILTPLGNLSRAEIYANILDNALSERWIVPAGKVPFAAFLLLLVAFAAWLSLHYPQVLTVTVLSFTILLIVALSFSLFDLFYYFTPMPPMFVAVTSSFLIFLSYQLTIRDHQNERLEKEKHFLLDVEELKHNFLSLISHDLKTPIAKIHGITDRILTHKTDPETESAIMALRSETNHLNRYIKTLLQVSRAESHDFQLNRDSMDINETIESVCEELSSLAQTKSLRIEMNLEPMFLFEADQLLMHEVVLNLLENAIKFSPDGGVIRLSSREVDGQVIVMVEDQGPGIDPQDIQKIFDKFYRGEEGKSHSKGSGLGLYLVKYFIERHKGKVLVESQIGEGTRIGFSLPIQSQDSALEGDILYEATT